MEKRTYRSTSEPVFARETEKEFVKETVEEELGSQLLPETLGTAGQVLTVNEAGTGVEWADASGGSMVYLHDLIVNLEESGSNYFQFSFINTSNKNDYNVNDLLTMVQNHSYISINIPSQKNGNIYEIYNLSQSYDGQAFFVAKATTSLDLSNGTITTTEQKIYSVVSQTTTQL